MERNHMTKVVAVIPSCREECLRNFLQAWHPFPWDTTVIVWDGHTVPTFPGSGITVYGHNDISAIEELVGCRLFSRGDSAIRSYGFWQAVKMHKATHVVTLDDDCFPENGLRGNFVERHLDNLSLVPSWVSSIPGVQVRGLPYANALNHVDVAASMGLWTNNADVDAIHALMGVAYSKPGFEPPRGVRVMSRQQLFPFCGMNFAFPADMLPLLYFPKMGIGVSYGRFDDIWAGLGLQLACRWLNKHIVVGEPFVEHRRASDPFSSIKKEAPALELNEWLWRRFSQEPPNLYVTTAKGAALEIVGILKAASQEANRERKQEWSDYLFNWASYLEIWVNLCGPKLSKRQPAAEKAPAHPGEPVSEEEHQSLPEPSDH